MSHPTVHGSFRSKNHTFNERNYQAHYQKLLKIMQQTRKSNIIKPQAKRTFSLSANRGPLMKLQNKIDKQKMKKIFQKSSFIRTIFPQDNYFHVIKSNKLMSKMNSKHKIQEKHNQLINNHQNTNIMNNKTNKQSITYVMLIIRFMDNKKFCKNSNYSLQISPYGLRSPVLNFNDLTKDAIGFKFKHLQNSQFYVQVYQVRGTKQHLIIKGKQKNDFQKYNIDLQIKYMKKINKKLVQIQYNSNKQQQKQNNWLKKYKQIKKPQLLSLKLVNHSKKNMNNNNDDDKQNYSSFKNIIKQSSSQPPFPELISYRQSQISTLNTNINNNVNINTNSNYKSHANISSFHPQSIKKLHSIKQLKNNHQHNINNNINSCSSTILTHNMFTQRNLSNRLFKSSQQNRIKYLTKINNPFFQVKIQNNQNQQQNQNQFNHNIKSIQANQKQLNEVNNSKQSLTHRGVFNSKKPSLLTKATLNQYHKHSKHNSSEIIQEFNNQNQFNTTNFSKYTPRSQQLKRNNLLLKDLPKIYQKNTRQNKNNDLSIINNQKFCNNQQINNQQNYKVFNIKNQKIKLIPNHIQTPLFGGSGSFIDQQPIQQQDYEQKFNKNQQKKIKILNLIKIRINKII